MYKKLLKVSTSKGIRVPVFVRSIKEKCIIKSNYIKQVELDNPSFSKNGKLVIICDKKNYNKIIAKLTNYLENLFLKDLSDENIDSSIGNNSIKRGNDKTNSGTNIKPIERKGDTTILCSSGGRTKQTENS
ncbi:MAG: hypothetical protein P8Y97_00050 [Candidatus Lokiarchaeota archaeon]